MIVKAKSPSKTWKVLNSMDEDENSEQATDNVIKSVETWPTNVGGSAMEYTTRATGLGS